MSYQVRRGNYAWEIFSSKSEYGVSWEDAVKMLIRLSQSTLKNTFSGYMVKFELST